MKKLFTFIYLLQSIYLFASYDTIKVNSEVKDVTVFFQGAQITREVNLNLQTGKHLLLLEKLPLDILPQSIQIEGMENSIILSVKHETYNNKYMVKDKKRNELESKIKTSNFKIEDLRIEINVLNMEERLLSDNRNLNSNDGSKIDEIKQASEFYRAKLLEIQTLITSKKRTIQNISESIIELNKEINHLSFEKNKDYSKIMVILDSKKSQKQKIRINYNIKLAGWKPSYDFRVKDINSPLSIIYNANIFQTTGENWTNVNLKLSNANPKAKTDKPELKPWYINRRMEQKEDYIQIENGMGGIKGVVTDYEETIPFAQVKLYKDNKLVASTVSDFDGKYIFNPINEGRYSIKVAYFGHSPLNINHINVDEDKITIVNPTVKPNNLMSVVVMEERSSQIDAEAGSSMTYSVESLEKSPVRYVTDAVALAPGISSNGNGGIESVHDYRNYNYYSKSAEEKKLAINVKNHIANSLKLNVTNLEYTIEIPYTILSDGQEHKVKMKENQFSVEFIHLCLPKIDLSTYLIAKVPNVSELNLLKGDINLYYQGTFIGESIINKTQTKDTLEILLGKENSIIVQREENKKVNDKRISGSNIKQTLGYNITVRNNSSSDAKIKIIDQIPLSEKKSIEIEMLSPENLQPTNKGELEWTINLNSNEKQELNYSYSIKYPKYSSISF